MILGGWALYAGIYLGFAVASAQWHVWLLFVGYAMFYAFTEPAEKTLVANLVGPDRRGLAYGWFNAAVGIGTLPASLLFGGLYQAFGALVAFGVGCGAGVAGRADAAWACRPSMGRWVDRRPKKRQGPSSSSIGQSYLTACFGRASSDVILAPWPRKSRGCLLAGRIGHLRLSAALPPRSRLPASARRQCFPPWSSSDAVQKRTDVAVGTVCPEGTRFAPIVAFEPEYRGYAPGG